MDIPDQADVDVFLPPYSPRQVLDPDHPYSIGAMVKNLLERLLCTFNHWNGCQHVFMRKPTHFSESLWPHWRTAFELLHGRR